LKYYYENQDFDCTMSIMVMILTPSYKTILHLPSRNILATGL